jgi:lipid-A-disaccharide synthase-like uncharacterized protein
MDWQFAVVFINDRFLGVEWHAWKVVGWIGNVVFFSRFFVQWWATEKTKKVVVPNSFWWLSLIGSLLLLAYGLHRRDSVFIFAYAFTWIPYIRNLMISHRSKQSQLLCSNCQRWCASTALFCSQCGHQIGEISEAAKT